MMELKTVNRPTLSATFVSKTTKQGRHFDTGTGLHLWVKSPNQKYWIFRFTYSNKRRDMSLGVYPLISLAEARKRALEARNEVAQGIDPIAAKNERKRLREESTAKKMTFREFAGQCIELKAPEWKNPKHESQWKFTLREYADPIIGGKALDQVTTEDIIAILRPIWFTKTETASRLRGRLEWILAAATTRKLREGVNPAQWRGHLETILARPNKIKKVIHHKALHFSQLPIFIAKLREKDCVSALALEFTILNCTRTSEVINATRVEVNNGIWTIPAERMKTKVEHRIPLSDRALEILEISRHLDPESQYLFSNNGQPLSNMAMLALIKRGGLDITVHGFRSTFRDWVAETTDHSSEVGEKALSHKIPNKVEAAYRRGDLMEKRVELMRHWSAYCNQGCANNILLLKTG
jgi:integrase